MGRVCGDKRSGEVELFLGHAKALRTAKGAKGEVTRGVWKNGNLFSYPRRAAEVAERKRGVAT